MTHPKASLILSLSIVIAAICTEAAGGNFQGLKVLVYDGGGDSYIQQALPLIGISVSDSNLRTPDNPVTLTDLATHDILIVGWNEGGNMSGLPPAVLSSGITGRILLTGHDADVHAANNKTAAQTFLSQAISFVTNMHGVTGLVALADTTTAFSYLPAEWGISATGGMSLEDINSFTPDGIASGVFAGLTPNDMSNWNQSYHAKFNTWGPIFKSFELGRTGLDVVTIATTKIWGHISITDVIDGNCVVPGSTIKYRICYDFNNCGDSNVKVIDYLPGEVDYNSSVGDYNAIARTVTWNLGTRNRMDSGCLELSVIVNNSVLPGQNIDNIAEVNGDVCYKRAVNYTPVCYWAPQVIYVDKNAAGGLNNGSSWDNAFTDFNDALDCAPLYAENFGGCEIWVAGGTPYKPTYSYPDTYYGATFQIPAGNITIRGHFGGMEVNETSPDQRDFNNAAYETILDGNLAPGQKANYTVTCNGIGAGLLLDGLTFTGAGDRGLYINNYSYPSIIRCKFTGNGSYGIYADNYSEPDINDCNFLENGTYGTGIYSSHSSWPYLKNCVFDGNNNNNYGLKGDSSPMLVEDCIIKRQRSDGMNFTNSYITLNRCEIEDNGADGINYSGQHLEITDCNIQGQGGNGISCSSSSVEIKGCKIEDNQSIGIYGSNTSIEVTECGILGNGYDGIRLGSASVPTITNNIISNNNGNGIYTQDIEVALIKNNWIYHNGSGNTDAGLHFEYSDFPPIVRNNTITQNAPYGIYVNQGFDPCLINDIIYGNGTGASKNIYSVRGLSNVSASYCCIGGGFSGVDNISCDPCFRNPDTNDFHLKDDSNCIDAGDPCADYTGETDIDGQCRVMFVKSDMRIDIGADEFSPKADYNGDLIVNFVDFANLARRWRQNDPNISLDGDNDVDIYDLAQYCNDWLWLAQCSEMYQSLTVQSENNLNMSAESETPASTNGTDASNVSEGSATTASMTTEQATVEVPVDNQQQSVLAGEGQTAGIWLVYDGNMMPAYGDEITVYIHSDPTLFCMEPAIEVAGDANITTAMSEADCNNFGWDNGWNSDPYIDPAGWLYLSGVSWGGVVNGTVGYFKFLYYSGEVTVSITEDSGAYDANCQPVLFSGQPLLFGRDPNE